LVLPTGAKTRNNRQKKKKKNGEGVDKLPRKDKKENALTKSKKEGEDNRVKKQDQIGWKTWVLRTGQAERREKTCQGCDKNGKGRKKH